MKRESFCLGVVHYVSFPDTIMGRGAIAPTLEEILRIDEVQAVEITWIRDKAQRRAVKELLDLWNGVVVYSGAPILALSHKSLCSLDKALRSESVDMARQIIDEADYFDADFVLLISGPDPGIQRRHEARSALIESLITLVHYAEAVNGQLMVTLEPADRDIHRRQLIGPISESVEISKAVREHYRRFGLTIDLSHLAQLGEDARQAISMARGYFHHVHIANAVVKNREHPRFGDEHPRFGIEEGAHDQDSIVEFLRDLKGIGFFQESATRDRPVVSIEVKPDKGEDPLALMHQSIHTFLEACKMA